MQNVHEISNAEDIFNQKLLDAIKYALEEDLSLYTICGMLDTVKSSFQLSGIIEIEVEAE